MVSFPLIAETMIAGKEWIAETKNTNQIAFVNGIFVATGRFADPGTNMFMRTYEARFPFSLLSGW